MKAAVMNKKKSFYYDVTFCIDKELKKQKQLYLHFKEIMSCRKSSEAFSRAFVECGKASQIEINQTRSETTVTTKTFINEQTFIETEFLPPCRQRLVPQFQVNIKARFTRWNVLLFFYGFKSFSRKKSS